MKNDPDTACPVCWRAEATPLQRAARRLAEAAWSDQTLRMVAASVSAYSVMLGGRERTWYDRHRDNWVRNGDDAELTRMLRHV